MKREKDNACIVKGERKSFFFFRERDQKAKNTDNVREEGKIKGKGFWNFNLSNRAFTTYDKLFMDYKHNVVMTMLVWETLFATMLIWEKKTICMHNQKFVPSLCIVWFDVITYAKMPKRITTTLFFVCSIFFNYIILSTNWWPICQLLLRIGKIQW